MPSASDNTATAVKPGFFFSIRQPNCKSCSIPTPHWFFFRLRRSKMFIVSEPVYIALRTERDVLFQTQAINITLLRSIALATMLALQSTSLVPKCYQWIDFRRPTRGHEARDESNPDQQQRHRNE